MARGRLDIGGWDENVNSQDWVLWLSSGHARKRHERHRSYLSCYRIHDEQLSTEHSKDGTRERAGRYLLRTEREDPSSFQPHSPSAWTPRPASMVVTWSSAITKTIARASEPGSLTWYTTRPECPPGPTLRWSVKWPV